MIDVLHLGVRQTQAHANFHPLGADLPGDVDQVGLRQQAFLRVAQVQRQVLVLAQDEAALRVLRLWKQSRKRGAFEPLLSRFRTRQENEAGSRREKIKTLMLVCDKKMEGKKERRK